MGLLWHVSWAESKQAQRCLLTDSWLFHVASFMAKRAVWKSSIFDDCSPVGGNILRISMAEDTHSCHFCAIQNPKTDGVNRGSSFLPWWVAAECLLSRNCAAGEQWPGLVSLLPGGWPRTFPAGPFPLPWRRGGSPHHACKLSKRHKRMSPASLSPRLGHAHI